MIKVFFRYDDYSSTSPLDVDYGLIDLMQRKSLVCTFAVVPAVTTGEYHCPGTREELLLGDEKLKILKQATREGIVDLALHGWNHRTHKMALPPTPSEFRGLPQNEQEFIIKRGYDFLKKETGHAPQVFVPPWNSYDKNTIRAMKNVGISCISAHRYSPVYESACIRYVPVTIEINGLRRAIKCARKHIDPDPVIGVMLHPYDFSESKDTRCKINLSDLEGVISWLKKCPDVYIESACSLSKKNAYTMDAIRFKHNSPSVFENIYPSFVKKTYQNTIYMSTENAKKDRWKKIISTALYHTGVATLAFIIGIILLSLLPSDKASILNSAQIFIGFCIIILITRTLLVKEIYFRSMTVLSFLSGLMLAIIF